MSRVLREDAQPDDVAAFWFTRQRAGAMTSSDAGAFQAWLDGSQEHQAAFKKIERTWALIGDLEDNPEMIEAREGEEAGMRAEAGRRMALIGAGGLAAAFCLWALMNPTIVSRLPWAAPDPTQEFRTSVGQRTSVTLLDGSIVTLDTDTVLRAQLSSRERRIELAHGRASFQVAKDKSRPFIVSAAGKSVRATGTAFDVRAEPDRFEVTLIEGRVQVRDERAKFEDGPGADMRQGWRLAIGADARWRMEPVSIAQEISWHDGMLAFFDEPLSSAVSEMNRYSNRKIVFRGEPPATFVLGRFNTGDIEGFVSTVEMNKLARVVSRTDQKIEIAAW